MNNKSAVIIGGGVIGLSCAWELAQRGVEVTVLERNEIGRQATGASLGVLYPPSPLRQGSFYDLHRESIKVYPEYADKLQKLTGVDLEYTRGGSLKIFDNLAQYERAARELKKQEELYPDNKILEVISEEKVRKLEPEMMVNEYGAILHHTAAKLTVECLIKALLEACYKSGVKILTSKTVDELDFSKNKVSGIRAGGEFISVENVIASGGAWLSELHPLLRTYTPVEPVRGQAILLKTSPDFMNSKTMIRGHKIYFIPGPEGYVTLGATTEDDSGYDDSTTVWGIRKLMNAAFELSPRVEQAKIIRVWAGLRPSSLSGRPYICRIPGVSNLYAAGGHYKTGVALAPVTALAIADLVCSGETDFDISTTCPVGD